MSVSKASLRQISMKSNRTQLLVDSPSSNSWTSSFLTPVNALFTIKSDFGKILSGPKSVLEEPTF